ncbi:MAG: hypothetical protein ACREV0_04930, partial [Burkholderiales bacterium]
MKLRRTRSRKDSDPPLLTEVVIEPKPPIPTLQDEVETRTSLSVTGREFAEFEARVCEELQRALRAHGRFDSDAAFSELSSRLQRAVRRTLRDYFATEGAMEDDIIPAFSRPSVPDPFDPSTALGTGFAKDEPQSSISESQSSILDPQPFSMPLAKSFEPHEIERRWYELWESSGWFKPRAG